MAASVPPSERPSVPKRYMAYRNFVKALPLLTSVREIMDDPSYDVWFINFSSAVQANHSLSHVPVCEANMTLCAGKPGGSCSHAGGWSCPCAEEVLQPARCSHLYHDQSQVRRLDRPASAAAAAASAPPRPGGAGAGGADSGCPRPRGTRRATATARRPPATWAACQLESTSSTTATPTCAPVAARSTLVLRRAISAAVIDLPWLPCNELPNYGAGIS